MDEGRRKTLLKMVEGARSTGVLPSSKPPAINTRNLPARGPGGSEDNSPQEPAPASARTARPGTGKPAAKGAAASAGAAAPKADTGARTCLHVCACHCSRQHTSRRYVESCPRSAPHALHGYAMYAW